MRLVCLLPIRHNPKGVRPAFYLIFSVLFAKCNFAICKLHILIVLCEANGKMNTTEPVFE